MKKILAIILMLVITQAFSRAHDFFANTIYDHFDVSIGKGLASVEDIVDETGAASFTEANLLLEYYELGGKLIFGTDLDWNMKGGKEGLRDIDVNYLIGGMGSIEVGYALINDEDIVVGLVGQATFAAKSADSFGLGFGAKMVVITVGTKAEMTIQYLSSSVIEVSSDIIHSLDKIDGEVSFKTDFSYGIKDDEVKRFHLGIGFSKIIGRCAGATINLGFEAGALTNNAYFAGPYASIYLSVNATSTYLKKLKK